jgi:hypothetical protein
LECEKDDTKGLVKREYLERLKIVVSEDCDVGPFIDHMRNHINMIKIVYTEKITRYEHVVWKDRWLGTDIQILHITIYSRFVL